MSEAVMTNAWIKRNPQVNRQVRLFCFPYAGGGSSAYVPWVNDISPDIEICPVQLPGREGRMREQPFTRMEPLIEELAQALEPYLDIPFAFYGHSLGGLISFELARQLRRQNGPLPIHLFVSGCPAPQLPTRDQPMSELPEAEFIQSLRRFNRTPDSVLQDADIMRFLIPLLRADFALYENYTYTSEEPLALPISAYGGLADFRAAQEDVAAWKEQTTGKFFYRIYSGDHFFIQTRKKVLLQGLRQDLLLPSDKQYRNSQMATPARAMISTDRSRDTGPFCKAL